MLDSLSYWLSECDSIINYHDFPYTTYSINISLAGEIKEYYYERKVITPFEKCIDQSIENNHIYLTFSPEAYCNFYQEDNSQEKEICRYILDILDNISYVSMDYTKELNDLFENPLKKKFFSSEYSVSPYFKPLEYMSHRVVHNDDEDYLSGLIGKELLKTGKWEIGVVADSRRSEIAHVVVEWLYNRLKRMVAEFNPDGIVETIYHDLEETLYGLLLTERRFYSDCLCYPEKENEILKTFNDLNQTSLALKFLMEYVTAKLPSGTKHFGSGKYEELLAICSMIIQWAYRGDLFYYNIVNTHVEFLKSKRIGMEHTEFESINQYNENYRQRQLKYNGSYSLRKKYKSKNIDYQKEINDAFIAEFGYSYTDFTQVIATMFNIVDGDIQCVEQSELPTRLIELNTSLNEELITKILKDITYSQREDFLKLPDNYTQNDVYPWRFNRKYCFIRRPVISKGSKLIWGNKQLFHMVEYITDLIYSGKFKANSDTMKKLCGRITKDKGDEFNDIIFHMIEDMGVFSVYQKVKKINGKKISHDGNDLGDIDILIIDKETGRLIVTEVKNFRYSRNPYEIQQEHEKMFVDGSSSCFVTKHKKRITWIAEHLEDLKQQYGLDNRTWKVTGLFIVNQALISSYVYKQDIRCISTSELSIEALRKFQ